MLCSEEQKKKRKFTMEDVRVVIHKVDVFQIPFCIIVELLRRQ